ncbi:uncharacterized protein PFL1_01137 [Pseudozyma flocculosa PF-1]|uniref:Uncharacterized protein n=1 Tax=Pseudozyma flocculosa TaxID=84751 RepID=A0A5C3EWF1_9BASI|nr:uncharacterized protein PFL1_01137 [Pseudozyma flocculosa PF-1]EPQ30948.1 hypothetical protein PFL1_01137 [Pseudozyma flocculosa PF-1]SPO35777.1 uncharacterized protein PSFLO_01248 [Pseudozyma flocculosa]
MSSLLRSAQSLFDSPVLRSSRSLLESTLFRSAEPTPSRTAAALDLLFGPPVPYFVSIFSQACRLIAVAIVLPIFFVGLLDFAGYAVFRTLGLHRQRVRVKRPRDSTGPPQRFVKRQPRQYQSDRGRPTDNSNVPSIVKAPLLSPGTYDAETLLRHRARSLSAASEDFDREYINSGGYFARVGVKKGRGASGDDDADDLLSPSEGEEGGGAAYPQSLRVPGIGVDGALGFMDTDGESGTESGRNSPVRRFASLERPSPARRRGLSGGLKFTKVTDDDEQSRMQSLTPQSPATGAAAATNKPTTKAASETSEAGGTESMGGSWIGIETGDDPAAVVDAAAAAAADLEPTSSF